MPRLTVADRVSAVAAAAAHDLNDELTVILSTANLALRSLPPGHPGRPLLLELQSAAMRASWKTSGLLEFTARRGACATAATLEKTIDAINS
jgi:hypothetical protein